MEELTIDNTPVTNEKDQEAVIEAVLFTMGSAVELKQLATAIGQDKETAKAAVERLMKQQLHFCYTDELLFQKYREVHLFPLYCKNLNPKGICPLILQHSFYLNCP